MSPEHGPSPGQSEGKPGKKGEVVKALLFPAPEVLEMLNETVAPTEKNVVGISEIGTKQLTDFFTGPVGGKGGGGGPEAAKTKH